MKQLSPQLNFWQNLPRPFFMLAPLYDVTDAAFRFLIAKTAKPHVMMTEFVSADGLCSDAGREKLIKDLRYSDIERPIVAQLFTAKPENMFTAATLIQELGFDGIDINMGCPDKAIMKQGCGASLIKHPALAQELIRAAQEGGRGLPISVKTRLGDTRDELDSWLPALLETSPATITIHARTRKEMSKVPAHWDAVGRAVAIAAGSGVLIVGNGDVTDLADARAKAAQTGCDGVMLGRAIFGNPWLFDESNSFETIAINQKLDMLMEHVQLFEKLMTGVKRFDIMKKHFKAYVNGFDGAKELRAQLMTAENTREVDIIIDQWRTQNLLPQQHLI